MAADALVPCVAKPSAASVGSSYPFHPPKKSETIQIQTIDEAVVDLNHSGTETRIFLDK